jgi:hypothetical protein
MLDIKDEVDTNALMIAWRFGSSPHVSEGIIFIDLIHLTANGEFPELIIIVLVDSECMVAIVWEENTELVSGSTSFGLKLSLPAHASELDSARGNAFERLPSWSVKKVIVFSIFGTSDGIFFCHDRERFKGFRAIFPMNKDIV